MKLRTWSTFNKIIALNVCVFDKIARCSTLLLSAGCQFIDENLDNLIEIFNNYIASLGYMILWSFECTPFSNGANGKLCFFRLDVKTISRKFLFLAVIDDDIILKLSNYIILWFLFGAFETTISNFPYYCVWCLHSLFLMYMFNICLFFILLHLVVYLYFFLVFVVWVYSQLVLRNVCCCLWPPLRSERNLYFVSVCQDFPCVWPCHSHHILAHLYLFSPSYLLMFNSRGPMCDTAFGVWHTFWLAKSLNRIRIVQLCAAWSSIS